MTEEFELTAAEIYTLNKASLAEALVDHVAGLDRPHAKLIVETFFELVAEHLEKGDTVKIQVSATSRFATRWLARAAT